MPLWLVGSGPMAKAYADVLQAQNVDFIVVGRDPQKAAALAEPYGKASAGGGIDGALAAGTVPAGAIVAAPVDALAAICSRLLQAGVKAILVEKPGGLDEREVAALADEAAGTGARIAVGYNRRFYESIRETRRRIEEGGGVLSFNFEFTEIADRIEPLPTPAPVKRRWFYANSTHVVDLAFHLCGDPVDLVARQQGALPWHPDGAVFTGLGVSERNAPFTYFGDWRTPGRWALEINTAAERIVLRPIEKLAVMKRGKFALEDVELQDELDRAYKPGLYRQVDAFLNGGPDAALLPSIAEHAARMTNVMARIAYPSSASN